MGDHCCLAFDAETERAAAVAAFIHAGLAAGDQVLYFSDTGVGRAVGMLAGREIAPESYLSSGQLLVQPAGQAYLGQRPFDATSMLDVVAEHIQQAVRRGYSGLRIVGEMTWAVRNGVPPDRLWEFEGRLTDLVAARPASALCLYDRRGFSPGEVAAAEQTHPRGVAASPVHDDGMLRILATQLPPGLRLVGEMDLSNGYVLDGALRAAADGGHGDVCVDASALEFIDVPGVSLLVEAAQRLGDNRRLVLESPGRVVRRILELGWGRDQPGNLLICEDTAA